MGCCISFQENAARQSWHRQWLRPRNNEQSLYHPVPLRKKRRLSALKYSNLNIQPRNVNCRLDIPLQVSITPPSGSLHKCFIYASCDSAWEVTRGGPGRGCQVMKVKQGWVGVPPSPWLFTQEQGLVPTCAGPPALAVHSAPTAPSLESNVI
jgi:hypothetical protein